MSRRRCKFHCAAAALIFLLGVVRGIGSIVDFINNTDVLIETNTDSAVIVLLNMFLILLSAAAFITAIGVYEQNKNSIYFGIIISIVFIINSILYGYILSEQTIADAVIINTITAVVIITLLILGRRSLNIIEESERTTTLNKNPEHILSH
jgi:lysylphosphatidylglycerol synthetase-like protein (DUF2156 family)